MANDLVFLVAVVLLKFQFKACVWISTFTDIILYLSKTQAEIASIQDFLLHNQQIKLASVKLLSVLHFIHQYLTPAMMKL